MSLMEKFADPTLIDTLSAGEKATGALITTCMGMGITFVVLILLWGIIALMNKAIVATDGPKVNFMVPSGVVTTTALPTVSIADSVHADEQLIAVITAAIVAYEGANQGKGNFVVRKINRVKGQVPAWANAGTMDCIETRKF